MAEPSCPGCRARDERIAALEARVNELLCRLADLEAKLQTNATNSSTPPSANPLDAPKPVVKKKSKRKPGGQPGHPPRLKQLLPPERVTNTFVVVPEVCAHCQTTLPVTATADDPPPTRFQTVELPPVAVIVTEYQGHSRTCPCCGKVTTATIPAELCQHSVGPRLTATLCYFTGTFGLSKRAVETIADEVFAAPIALGTVSNLEQEMSAALATPFQQVLDVVRAADVKHVDETSWKRAGKLCWLWAAATATFALYLIYDRRSVAGLKALLGADPNGIICSDRYSVYDGIPVERRQLCWSHLKRDFQKVVDRGGSGAVIGRKALRVVREVFRLWHLFRGGSQTRAELQRGMKPLQNRLQRLLLEGSLGDDARLEQFCENLLAVEEALWTFVRVENVEPTNNHQERLLRRAVLWRKRSFGCWSAAGCRYVERILTVVQTLRLQQRGVLAYLEEVITAARAGNAIPSIALPG